MGVQRQKIFRLPERNGCGFVCMCMYMGNCVGIRTESDSAPDNFEPQASPSVSSSQFHLCCLFFEQAESKPANAYQEEYALNPCGTQKDIRNDQQSLPANAFQEEYALNLCDRKKDIKITQFSQRKRQAGVVVTKHS
ncbi:hypothetical protein HAX54_037670 [Datura stramonium]|uniref:Uncharacterized protein n=1 Tax=Datura stramonium TaxID=4076 RepID=A0ABS8VLG3_DATST|nr:hypothetical protein [Datura stramonium]